MHASRVTAFLLTASAMLVSLAACATPVGTTRESMHPLRIVNATFDGVTSLAIAPSGSTDFHVIALERPLPGGLASVMVNVPAGDCHRDVRVTFHGERTLFYPNLDVCRNDGLRLAAGSARGGRSMRPQGSLDAAGSP